MHDDLRLHDHVQRVRWVIQQAHSSTACRWYCTAGETVEHQGGFFVTEDQGQSWRRLLRGSDGSPAAGKQGIPYILGLALNPWRQGEILITAANNAPGGMLFWSRNTHAFCVGSSNHTPVRASLGQARCVLIVERCGCS